VRVETLFCTLPYMSVLSIYLENGKDMITNIIFERHNFILNHTYMYLKLYQVVKKTLEKYTKYVSVCFTLVKYKCPWYWKSRLIDFDFWCFNATFSNISAISWRPVLVVEKAVVPGEEKVEGREKYTYNVHIIYISIAMPERLLNFNLFLRIRIIDLRYTMPFTDHTLYIYGHN